MQHQDSVYDLSEIRKAVVQSQENYYVSDLGQASEALDLAARGLEAFVAQWRDNLRIPNPPAPNSPSSRSADALRLVPDTLRQQLMEMRDEIRFAESLHRQAAAFASGWSHLLSEKLQLEVGPSYSHDGSSHGMDLQGNKRVVAVG
ncbi:MAG: hypothetical protein JNL98_40545 [Bryobacterales bacterium]|nr:hypothetical protein [Bryobacterales bacterium]